MRSRAGRWTLALVVAALLAGCSQPPATPDPNASEGAAQSGDSAAEPAATPTDPGPGGAVLEVPYQDSLQVEPAAGWEFTDCAAVRRAVTTSTAKVGDEAVRVGECAKDGFTLISERYSVELKPFRLRVPARSAGVELDWDYQVQLDAPEPAAADKEVTLGYPGTAGAPLRVPYSDLGITCTECRAGVSIKVTGVDPAGASAVASSTHLVISPADARPGTVTVRFALADDTGEFGADSTLTARFAPQGASPLGAAHAVVVLPGDKALPIDVRELLAPEPAERITVDACGKPSAGKLTCARSGKLRYTPNAAPGAGGDLLLDQFSYTVSTPEGGLATGSISVVSASSTLASSQVQAGGAPGAAVQTAYVPPAPPAQQGPATDRLRQVKRLLKDVGA